MYYGREYIKKNYTQLHVKRLFTSVLLIVAEQ